MIKYFNKCFLTLFLLRLPKDRLKLQQLESIARLFYSHDNDKDVTKEAERVINLLDQTNIAVESLRSVPEDEAKDALDAAKLSHEETIKNLEQGQHLSVLPESEGSRIVQPRTSSLSALDDNRNSRPSTSPGNRRNVNFNDFHSSSNESCRSGSSTTSSRWKSVRMVGRNSAKMANSSKSTSTTSKTTTSTTKSPINKSSAVNKSINSKTSTNSTSSSNTSKTATTSSISSNSKTTTSTNSSSSAYSSNINNNKTNTNKTSSASKTKKTVAISNKPNNSSSNNNQSQAFDPFGHWSSSSDEDDNPRSFRNNNNQNKKKKSTTKKKFN